ncbi:MAG: hydrogenase nickel incorporation protein HypB [Euryarchaeota archaeon]|nr:hydrogenase nickel incorporation protein HypB [Euryarchaeota archaeon]
MHRVSEVEVQEDLLQANRELAERNRRLLEEKGVVAVEVSGAIGSGKSTLIELAVGELKQYRIAAIAGDVVASLDAERFRRLGIEVVPLNTGRECHLDAHLVGHALEQLPLEELDLIFVENVGNLICPADFELGAQVRVVVVSVTEGDDIVAKHPGIFRRAQLAVINKIDLASFVGADPEKMARDARRLNPELEVLQLSARTGENLSSWYGFLRRVAELKPTSSGR